MFKSLKDILPGTIEELGIGERLEAAAVFSAWRTVVARLPAHAREARPRRFRHGALEVEAPSSAAVHELHMRVPQLMREVNTILGRPLVTKLDFRARGRRAPTRNAPPQPRSAAERADKTPADTTSTEKAAPNAAAANNPADRERRLRQAIDLIQNPAVRQHALARLAATADQPARCTLCGTAITTPGLCPLCQAHEAQESGA